MNGLLTSGDYTNHARLIREAEPFIHLLSKRFLKSLVERGYVRGGKIP
jgi:hypothetical protein